MRALPLVFLVLIVLSAALATSFAHAGWQTGGVQISPPLVGNEYIDIGSMAVSDGAQGAIVTWKRVISYPEYDATEYSMTAQRIDVAGEIPASWPPSGSLVRQWTSSPSPSAITILPLPVLANGAGGAISPQVFQQFQIEYLVMLHLYQISPSGTVTGTPNYSGTGILSGPHVNQVEVDADGSGGVVYIALPRTYGPCCGPRYSTVYADRVDAQGNSLWYPNYPSFTRSDSLVGEFDVLPDGMGGAFFAWAEISSNGLPGLYVQHIDGSGAVHPGWPLEGRLVGKTSSITLPWGERANVKLASNGAGGVFVVWADNLNGQLDLFGNVVLTDGSLAAGIPVGGRQLVTPETTDDVHGLESDEQGGVFMVSVSRSSGAGTTRIRLHRLDPTLLPREGWPGGGLLLTTRWSSEPAVALAADGLGGAFVAFDGDGTAYPTGLIAQHLAGIGSPAPGWTTGGYQLSPTGFSGRIVPSGSGAIVAWNDSRSGARGIYAQRLVPDGPVAVQVSLISSDVAPGEASLRWYVTGAAALSATIERRTEGSGWATLGAVNADGQGNVRYVDRSVESGRYGYRLSWSEDGATQHSGEAWVDVPDAWRLALSAPRPNPGAGPATFSVTLPTRAPAGLELLDLQGRRVAHRDLGTFDAGVHRVTIDEASTLSPGVYLARLTHGGESRTVRISRIR